jgi:hypothetical protein
MLGLISLAGPVQAQLNVITVDCTPLVSPGVGSFGPTNTMGMALQAVDQGGDFIVTEVMPAAFRALTPAQLSAFDLIAVNNHPARLGDSCVAGVGGGLGTAWHSAVGTLAGGRVVLSSHDAPRFKLLRTPPAPPLFTGFEPFGTIGLVRQAALWAGGIPARTGLLIFNDAARFDPGAGPPIGGVGWGNSELNLPAAWGITDIDQAGGNYMDGGYTDILPAFQNHPIYDGTAVGGVILSDVRGAQDSISSFSANIGDTSFHSVFNSFNVNIFTPTEAVVNAGVIDVGSLCPSSCALNAAAGPDGLAITLIRNGTIEVAVDIKPQSCRNPFNVKAKGVLPVAIAGTDMFDVTLIDPATVQLEGVAPLRWSFDDVATPYEPFTGKQDAFDCTDEGADGFIDLALKFSRQEIANALGTVSDGDVLVLTLTGALLDGTFVVGEDVVVVLKKGK